MSADLTVEVSGPLFDRRAPAEIQAMLDQIRWEVGMDAFSELHLIMDQSFKNPTPYYETQVRIDRQRDEVTIDDRGIVYGPWLEGTSSRNQTTRFKGYAMFRKATQYVQGKVTVIAERVVAKTVGKLG